MLRAAHKAEVFLSPAVGSMKRLRHGELQKSHLPRLLRSTGGPIGVTASSEGKDKALSTLSLAVLGSGLIGQSLGYLSNLPSSLLVATGLAAYAWFKKSLDATATLCAWSVLFVTHFCSYVVSAQLMVFFASSTSWTKFKASTKEKFTVEKDKRTWVQVMCNAGWQLLFAVLFKLSKSIESPSWLAEGGVFFFAAALGSFACCCGDTWASEIGVLSKSEPRLITNLKKVPRGTNGGVSWLGLVSSMLGGLIIGLTTFLATLFATNSPMSQQVLSRQFQLLWLGIIGGLGGSLIDSLLGATLQFSGVDQTLQKVVNYPGPSISRITGIDLLSNNQVNLISALIAGLMVGWLAQTNYTNLLFSF